MWPATTTRSPVTGSRALVPVADPGFTPGHPGRGVHHAVGGRARPVTCTVGGLAGVPADADAVVLNVTVTDTTGCQLLDGVAHRATATHRLVS